MISSSTFNEYTASGADGPIIIWTDGYARDAMDAQTAVGVGRKRKGQLAHVAPYGYVRRGDGLADAADELCRLGRVSRREAEELLGHAQWLDCIFLDPARLPQNGAEYASENSSSAQNIPGEACVHPEEDPGEEDPLGDIPCVAIGVEEPVPEPLRRILE